MDENFVLPDAQSPNLCLTHPTSSEFESIYSLSFLEWGDALNLPQYLEESAFLTTVPLARNGCMSIWLLTDETYPPDHRPILCSCETFRKRAFVVDPGGHLSEGIVHSVASVFCNPKYRGRGYAARLMHELAILLPDWQSQSKKCIGSILYSDIGKTYYANLGWHPFPLNNHIELDPIHIPELPQTGVRAVIREDLDQLCKDDEASIRTAMSGSLSEKTRMMVVPDLDHMLWHHSKEDFACEKLFGKHPRMKGAIIGELNDRMWVVWTHRYYGNPHGAPSNNTLYILRIVIERRDSGPDQREHQIEQMRALLWAAQSEAAEWSLSCVKLWDPAYLIQNMIERTGIQHRKVEREEESLASLLWFGGGSGREDMVEWLGNEKLEVPDSWEIAPSFLQIRDPGSSTDIVPSVEALHEKTKYLSRCAGVVNDPRAFLATEVFAFITKGCPAEIYLRFEDIVGFSDKSLDSSSTAGNCLGTIMNWEIEFAAESDASRIADVHMAAFGSNALLLAQFPTPAIRDQLRECIAKKAEDDIRDPKIAVLVARDHGKIISFAKWSLPVSTTEMYVESPWHWPAETNLSVLNEWTEKIEEAQQNILGGLSSYPNHLSIARDDTSLSKSAVELRISHFGLGLTFIGTDPEFERHGAATSLMNWGLDRCGKGNVPAYLESTLNAVPFYERLGFKTRDKVSIALKESGIYEEACCIFEPGTDTPVTSSSSDTKL